MVFGFAYEGSRSCLAGRAEATSSIHLCANSRRAGRLMKIMNLCCSCAWDRSMANIQMPNQEKMEESSSQTQFQFVAIPCAVHCLVVHGPMTVLTKDSFKDLSHAREPAIDKPPDPGLTPDPIVPSQARCSCNDCVQREEATGGFSLPPAASLCRSFRHRDEYSLTVLRL